MVMTAHAISKDAIVASMHHRIDTAKRTEQPYRHWFLDRCLTPDAAIAAQHLPFEAPALSGISGKRELHNATRKYFDIENRAKFPVCGAVAEAFQAAALTQKIEAAFGTTLKGTYLRIEFAKDINGFWLEPHTDLGVKGERALWALSGP